MSGFHHRSHDSTRDSRQCDLGSDFALSAPCGSIEPVGRRSNCFKLIVPRRDTNIVAFRRNKLGPSSVAEKVSASGFASLWFSGRSFATDNPNATLSFSGQTFGVVIDSISDVRQPHNPSVCAKKKYLTVVFHLGEGHRESLDCVDETGYVSMCIDSFSLGSFIDSFAG